MGRSEREERVESSESVARGEKRERRVEGSERGKNKRREVRDGSQ